jgi:hypothetical protein
MKTNRLIQLVSTLLAAIAVTACSKNDSETVQAPTPGTPTPTSRSVEVNAPIPHKDIDLVFSMVGAPTYNPATDTISATVNVANNGKAAIASTGSHPVNIGVVILGADGSLNTPPGKQDFVRIRLPRGLEQGEKLDLPVKFKVAPTLGGTVIIDAVQERVAWFRGYKKPVLTLGTFVRCKGEEKTACLSDGTAIATAQ